MTQCHNDIRLHRPTPCPPTLLVPWQRPCHRVAVPRSELTLFVFAVSCLWIRIQVRQMTSSSNLNGIQYHPFIGIYLTILFIKNYILYIFLIFGFVISDRTLCYQNEYYLVLFITKLSNIETHLPKI